MTVMNIHEAKTNLSRLLAMAEAGDEVVIARGGVPIARLVPIAAQGPARRFGALADRIKIGDAAAEPLDPAETALWE